MESITTEVVPIEISTSDAALGGDIIVRAEKYVSGTQLDEIAAWIRDAVEGDTKAIYDIEIVDGAGNKIADTGTMVQIDIDLPGVNSLPEDRQIVVYSVTADGQVIPCTTELRKRDDGTNYVSFETQHFSVYAIAEVEKLQPTPGPTPEAADTTTADPTGESTNSDQNAPADASVQVKDAEDAKTPPVKDGSVAVQETAATGSALNSTAISIWIGVGILAVLAGTAASIVVKKKKR